MSDSEDSDSFASICRMLTDTNFEDLKIKGYTVVPDVVSTEDCDDAIHQYHEWLTQFKDGTWPNTFNGIIKGYNSGHMKPTWEMRLKTKNVFAQLWKTEKLLTSFDSLAIARPPEDGQESFQDPDKNWLHTDQKESRYGLHSYQGALYLEEQCEDDWTFFAMAGSHLLLHDFYLKFPEASKDAEPICFHTLSPEELEFYKDCKLVRVPVPKGGMALWDSRLIHANARPLKGRKHSGRWRYTLFISMTPAIWATEKDMKVRREAYEKALMTTHWSSTGVDPYDATVSASYPFVADMDATGSASITFPHEIPECARTDEAKRLSGVIPYDFKDGKPNGDHYIPEFRKCSWQG